MRCRFKFSRREWWVLGLVYLVVVAYLYLRPEVVLPFRAHRSSSPEAYTVRDCGCQNPMAGAPLDESAVRQQLRRIQQQIDEQEAEALDRIR